MNDRLIKDLRDFDPKKQYPKYDGMRVITVQERSLEMDRVSNLIADMVRNGASDEEICRAVKYSMVIVDAPKHELNWKQSEQDFGILELKAKYQGSGTISLKQFSRQMPSPGYLFANLEDIRHHLMHDYDPENWTYTFAYPMSARMPRVKVEVTAEELRRNPDECLEHVVKIIAKKYDELMTRRYFGMDNNRLQKFIDGVHLVGGSVNVTFDSTDCEMQITIPDPVRSMDRILVSMNCCTPQKPVILLPGVSDIQFYNDRVTVVRFADGSFTKCVADVDEEGKSCFDPYTGVAFCLFKRMLGKEDGHKKFNNLMRKAMGVMDAKKKALEEQEKMKVERLRKEINKNNKKVRRAAEDREAFIEDIAEAVRRANAREVDK